MQDHSTVLEQNQLIFTKEAHVRRNMVFISELDTKMKNDINAARKKLTNSLNIREINFRTTPRQNFINLQHEEVVREMRNNNSQPQLINTNITNQASNQSPEDNDLKNQLMETRREMDILRQKYHLMDSQALFKANQTIASLTQTIQNNDHQARQVISGLHQEKQKLRNQNEQLLISIENIKNQNRTRSNDGQRVYPPCDRCRTLGLRIEELERELSEMSRKFGEEQQKMRRLQAQELAFKTQLDAKINALGEKLTTSQQELQIATNAKFQLQRRLVQLNGRDLSSRQQTESLEERYQILSSEYEKICAQCESLSIQNQNMNGQVDFITQKINQLNYEIDPYCKQGQQYELPEILQELEVKIGEYKLRISDSSAENQQILTRLVEKDSDFKKLNEEYSELLDRIQKYEDREVSFKTKIEELHRQLSMRMTENNSRDMWESTFIEQLNREKEQNAELNKTIREGDVALAEIKHKLIQAENYIRSEVSSKLEEQNKTISELINHKSSLQNQIASQSQSISQIEVYQLEIQTLNSQIQLFISQQGSNAKSQQIIFELEGLLAKSKEETLKMQADKREIESALNREIQRLKQENFKLQTDKREMENVLEREVQQLIAQINHTDTEDSKTIRELRAKLLEDKILSERQSHKICEDYENKIMALTNEFKLQIQGLEKEIKDSNYGNQKVSSALEEEDRLREKTRRFEQMLEQRDKKYEELQVAKDQTFSTLRMEIEELKLTTNQNNSTIKGLREQIHDTEISFEREKHGIIQDYQRKIKDITDQLSSQIKALSHQEKNKSGSEKYGQLVIKHNTLNIDYQHILKRLKEKQEWWANESTKHNLAIESINHEAELKVKELMQERNRAADLKIKEAIELSNRESDLKVQELVEANRTISEESLKYYRHLEQAESYISELQQKIDDLQRQAKNAISSQDNPSDSQLTRVTEALTRKEFAFKQEKEEIIQKYESLLEIQQQQTKHVFSTMEALEHQLKFQKELNLTFKQESEEWTRKLTISTKEAMEYKQLYQRTLISLRSMESEKTQLSQAIKQLQEEILMRSEEINRLSKAETNLPYREEISSLVSKVKNLESENIRSNKQINLLRSEISSRVEEIKKISSKTVEAPSHQLKQNQEEIGSLLTRLKQLQTDKDKSDLEITRLQTEVTRGSQEIDRLTFEINRLSTGYRESHDDEDLQLVRREIRERESRMNEMHEENEKIKAEYETQLRTRINELLNAQKTIEEMKIKIQSDSARKSDSRRSDSSNYQDAYSRIEMELQESRKLLNGASEHIAKLQQVITRAEEQIRGLNSYIVELQQKSENSSQKNSSPVKAFEEESGEEPIQDHIAKLQSQNMRLQSTVKELSMQITSIEGENMHKGPVAKQIDLTVLMKENEERLTHINSLTEQLLKLENQNVRQNQEVSKISQNLSAEIKAKNKELVDLQQKLSEEVEKANFFQGKLKEAEEYIFQSEGAREKEKIQFNNQIEQLEKMNRENILKLETLAKQTSTGQSQKSRNVNSEVQKLGEQIRQLESAKINLENELKQRKITLNNIQLVLAGKESRITEDGVKILSLSDKLAEFESIMQKLKQDSEQKDKELIIITAKLQTIEGTQKEQVESIKKKLLQNQIIEKTQQQFISDLQEMISSLNDNISQKDREIQILQEKTAQLELRAIQTHETTSNTQVEQKNKEIQFFKIKLLEAENYIFYLQKIKADFQSSKTQLSQETKEASRLAQENQQLKVDVSNFEVIVRRFEEYKITIEDTVSLRESHSQLKMKVDDLDNAIRQNRIQLDEKDKEILQLRQQLTTKIQNGNHIEAQRNILGDKLRQLEDKLKQSNYILSEVKKESDQQLKIMDILKSQKVGLEAQLREVVEQSVRKTTEDHFSQAELNHQLDDKQSIIGNLELSKKLLQDQLEELSEKLKQEKQELEFFKDKLNQAEEFIFHLESTQQTLEGQASARERTGKTEEELIEKIKGLQTQIVQLNKRYQQISHQLKGVSERLLLATQEKLEAETKVIDIRLALEQTENDFQLANKKLRNAQDQIVHLKGQVESMEEVSQKMKQMEGFLQKLNQEIHFFKTSNKKIQSQNKQIEQALKENVEKLKEVQSKWVEAQTKVKQLENSKVQLELQIADHKYQISNAVKEGEFFKAKLQQTVDQLKHFQDNKILVKPEKIDSGLESTIQNLEEIIKDLTKQKESVNHELNEAKLNFKKIEDILHRTEEKLDIQSQRVKALTEEKEIIQAKVVQTQSLLSSNVEQIESLQEEIHRTKQELIDSSKRYEEIVIDLTKELFSLKDQLKIKQQECVLLSQKPATILDTPRVDAASSNEQFFKNKLLEAENYIQTLQQQKVSIQVRYEVVNKKVLKQEDQIRNLHQEISADIIQKEGFSKTISQLKKENDNLNDNLRVVASQASNEDLIRLTSQVSQLKKDIDLQKNLFKEQNESLVRRNEELESFYTIEKQKYHRSEDAIVDLKKRLQDQDEQLNFFKKKLSEAEISLSNIELLKSSDKEVLSTMSENAQLKQQSLSLVLAHSKLEIDLKQTLQQLEEAKDKNSYFNNKLLEAEGYIIELERENREKIADRSNDQNLNILRDKILELEQKNREAEMKTILTEEKERNYLENIRTLEMKLTSTKESLVVAEQEIDSATIKNRQREEEMKNLDVEISKLGKDPTKEKQFFKKKLLAAEAYITDLIKENKSLKIHSSDEESKFQQFPKEIDRLNELMLSEQKIQVLSRKNKDLADKINQLEGYSMNRENQLQSLRETVQKFEEMLEEKQKKYQELITVLTGELEEKNQIIRELENQEPNYQKQIQGTESKSPDYLEPEPEHEHELASNRSSIPESENIDFFKGKLFEAEAFIKELQEDNQTSKKSIEDLNAKILRLDEQIANFRDRGSQNCSISSEQPFEEAKLLELLNEANNKLSELTTENAILAQKLSTIRIQIGKQEEKEQPSHQLSYLKEKLFEAESFIVELEREVQSLTQEGVDRENTVKQLQESIVNLTQHVVQAESLNKQLESKISELINQNQQLKSVPPLSVADSKSEQLLKKISDLESELEKEITQKESKIEYYTLQLNKKTSLEEEKVFENKFSSILNEKEEEINHLQGLLKTKEESIKDLSQKFQGVQRELEGSPINNGKYFQEKLLEAEGYISELEKENEQLNYNCDDLKQQIKAVEMTINELSEKLNQADTEKMIISKEFDALREENLRITLQLSEYKTKIAQVGEEKNQMMQSLEDKVKVLSQQLYEEHLKNQIQVDMLAHNLNQKGQKLKDSLIELKQLQEVNQELRKYYSIQEMVKENISKSVKFKECELEPALDDLEEAHNQIIRLQAENMKTQNFSEKLLEQIKRISQENNQLTEKLYHLSSRSLDGEGEANVDADISGSSAEKTVKREERRQQLQEQIQSLIGQITSLKTEIQEKTKIIDSENVAGLHTRIELSNLQEEHRKLKEKVDYLEDTRRQFEEFKIVVKEREAAQKELEDIQKELNESSEKGNKQSSQGDASVRRSRESPIKNKKLEESLEEASKELEDEMREESHHENKELREEILNLKVLLQQTEEENALLKIEKANEMAVIKEIGSANAELELRAIAFHSNEKELQDINIANQAKILELQRNIAQLTEQLLSKETKIQELESLLLNQKDSTEFPQTSSPVKGQESETVTEYTEQKGQTMNQQVESLRAQLDEERQHLVIAESQIQALASKIKVYEGQLLDKNAKISELEFQSRRIEQELLKQQEIMEEDMTEAEQRISEKEIQLGSREEKIGSSLRKLISMTQNNQEETDHTEVLSQLEEFPYLNELITSILYRLRLASAIQLEKGLKIDSQRQTIELLETKTVELQDQIARTRSEVTLLRQQNELLKTTNQKIEAELLKKMEERREQAEHKNVEIKKQSQDDRYNELLKELVEYQIHNNELQGQLGEITEAHQQLEKEIEEYKVQIKILTTGSQLKDLSHENLELRKKLQESMSMAKAIDNSSMGTQSLLRLQFLQICLERIDDIENEAIYLNDQIEHLASREKRLAALSSNEGQIVGQDSQLIERLQELEERLLKNASNIKQHQEKTDGQLYDLLKELLNDEQISEGSKRRIEDYLAQLEKQILRQHQQHQAEITILREQIARKEKEEIVFSDRSREDLLRQINNLNNAIEIYHQESMRRKKLYKQTLDSLLQDVYQLTEKLQDQECSELYRKIQEALDREEEEDLQFQGDDFIIAGGSGQVQVLEVRQRELESEQLNRFGDSVGELGQGEPIAIQTQAADNKPFLKYLLSVQDLDKEDLRLLKKKIAELKTRQVEDNLQFLRGKQKQLQEVMQLTNKDITPQNIQNIKTTLAINYSREEISQIFGSEDTDELINKLNEALCLDESFYKGQNSSFMRQEIEERMRRYYETPTTLSGEVFKHLQQLLTAKKDEDFYKSIEFLFKSLFEIQTEFESALKKKDEVYRLHNERMNQIFNKSSSDNSEDYLAEFERANEANEEELRMSSERKPNRSDRNSEDEERSRSPTSPSH